jgi:MtfA peptidase
MLIILAIVVLAIGVSAIFILKGKKPKLETGLPASDYETLLKDHIPYYGKLDYALQKRFVEKARDFLGAVRIEGVGFEITEVDRIMVAASAVIPILNFEGWNYTHLTNVIVYPDAFNNDFQFEGENRNIMGMVGSGFMNGQMLLSRAALIKGFSKNGGRENTAIHEFVHLLDDTDGAVDGVPENLMDHGSTLPWLKMIHQEMHRIKAGNSDINPYALTSEAEFLAVVSEYFFEKPEQFSKKHPELYQALAGMFNQNPAASATKE